jgi:FkbM family methyltransferase
MAAAALGGGGGAGDVRFFALSFWWAGLLAAYTYYDNDIIMNNSEERWSQSVKEQFITYSQYFEDWILYCALMDVKDGFYVDVGANDPCAISVTKALYDMGWRGINIEPLKEQYDKLCSDRPRDINLNIGAGSENGSLEFFLAGVGTTCDEDVALSYGNENLEKRTIPIMKLSDVFSKYIKDENQIIHFCKIDVEGFERSVLEGMDFSAHRPWVMVMESTLPGTHIPCHDKWESLLLDNDYEFGVAYNINRYYVDKTIDAEMRGKIKQRLRSVWRRTSRYTIVNNNREISRLYLLKRRVIEMARNLAG